MNTQTYEFAAVIQKVADIDGAYIIFPYVFAGLLRRRVISSPHDNSNPENGLTERQASV